MSSRIPILFLMLVVGCGLLPADTIQAYGIDWSRAAYVNMIQDNKLVNGIAGVIQIQLVGSGPNGQTVNRDTLCVDAFVDIYLGGYLYGTVVLTPPEVTGKQNLGTVAWLEDNALVPAQTSFLGTTSIPKADWVTSAAQGAGMQFAIWDIVEDNGDGFGAGRIQESNVEGSTTDAAVLQWAETYECLAMGSTSPSCALVPGVTPPGGVRVSNQAFVYVNTVLPGDPGNPGDPAQTLEGPQFFDHGPEPTPEPSTLGLGGLGLVAASLLLRKKLGYRSRKADPTS
jgi:PEP-CTERM motif